MSDIIEMPEMSDEEAAAPVTTDAMASALPNMLSALIPAAMQGIMNGDQDALALEVRGLRSAIDTLQQQLNSQHQLTAQVTEKGLVVSVHSPFTQHATLIPIEAMDNTVVEWLSTRDDVVVASLVKRVRERKQVRRQHVQQDN